MAAEQHRIIWLRDKYEFLRLEGYAQELGLNTNDFRIFEDGTIRVYLTGDRSKINFAYYLLRRDLERIAGLKNGKEIKK